MLGSTPALDSLRAALTACPAVAILRARNADRFPVVIDTLTDAGIRAVEITFTTEGAVGAIEEFARRKSDDVAVGAGTVLTADDARRAVDAGATYLISPAVCLDVISEGTRLGVPVLPGALTPTEILTAHRAGAAMVKVFPANQVGGPAYLKAIRGPLPGIELVPTGGVAIESVVGYLEAGAVAVGVGSPLQGDAADPDGDLAALATRARRLVQVAGRRG